MLFRLIREDADGKVQCIGKLKKDDPKSVEIPDWRKKKEEFSIIDTMIIINPVIIGGSKKYTLTFTAGSGGSVSKSTIANVDDGTPYYINGNTITVGTMYGSVTATPSSTSYVFSEWQDSGTGYVTGDMTFTAVFEVYKVSEVFASSTTSWILMNDGTLFGCGLNEYGQQGSGTSGSGTNVAVFNQRAKNVATVACSSATTWYVTKSGDLYGCGFNYYGQQGAGTSGSNANVTTFTKRASNVKKVYCSSYNTYYINDNDVLYGCGYGLTYLLGNGSTSNLTTFTQLATNVDTVTIGYGPSGTRGTAPADVWYVSKSNQLYHTGTGMSSSFSDTSFTLRATNVATIQAGFQAAIYIDTSKVAYGIGYVGAGSGSYTTSFTQLSTGVLFAGTGTYSAFYVLQNGDLYARGNYSGTGSTTPTYIFTKRASNVTDFQVNTSTYPYSGDRMVSNNSFYLNTSNQLYGCGDNAFGEQGTGNATKQYSYGLRASNVAKFWAFGSDNNNGISTWYLSTSNVLYSTGCNTYGQQGVGSTTNLTSFTSHTIPTPV